MLVLVGLGGNQGDVVGAFERAVAALGRELRVLARSSLWRSAPLGPAQDDFTNAAVLVAAAVPPRALLALCRGVEEARGRDRANEARWGPRSLDLDLLIAPGLVIESEELLLPHPRFAERRFALAPAAEVAPGWIHPCLHRTLADLSASPTIASQRCERVAGPSAWG